MLEEVRLLSVHRKKEENCLKNRGKSPDTHRTDRQTDTVNIEKELGREKSFSQIGVQSVTECPKIYRKSVLNLLRFVVNEINEGNNLLLQCQIIHKT